MERAIEKENVMFLLKTMVLMCIVCVVVTLYAEYRRMSKFERLLQNLTVVRPAEASSCARGRMRLSSSTASASSASSQSEHTDTDDHKPTP